MPALGASQAHTGHCRYEVHRGQFFRFWPRFEEPWIWMEIFVVARRDGCGVKWKVGQISALLPRQLLIFPLWDLSPNILLHNSWFDADRVGRCFTTHCMVIGIFNRPPVFNLFFIPFLSPQLSTSFGSPVIIDISYWPQPTKQGNVFKQSGRRGIPDILQRQYIRLRVCSFLSWLMLAWQRGQKNLNINLSNVSLVMQQQLWNCPVNSKTVLLLLC